MAFGQRLLKKPTRQRAAQQLEKGHPHFRVQLQIGAIVGTLGRSANPIRVRTGLR